MSGPRSGTPAQKSPAQTPVRAGSDRAGSGRAVPASAPPESSASDASVLRLTPVAGGFSLAVLARPGASHDALAGVSDGALVVRISAPPVEGAANERLIRFMAKEVLGIPRSHVTLDAGERSRHKRVIVLGLTEAELREKLQNKEKKGGTRPEVSDP